MIDIIKAKKYFKEYVSNYDINVPRINLKIIHTYYVAENARKIAKMLGLSEEEQDLAELIGLLHDIGRFEQVRIFGTFSDKTTIDHAYKAIEVLFSNCEIRNFIEDNKYDEIICKAIRNHNKFKVEDGLTEQELLYCNIIRDADKLDIFRVALDEKLEDFVTLEIEDISKEILTPSFFENFQNEQLLLVSECKSGVDCMVTVFAFIYDMNFKESLKIIQKNDYINKIVKKINAQDEYTKEKLEKIADYAMDYMNRKISEE